MLVGPSRREPVCPRASPDHFSIAVQLSHHRGAVATYRSDGDSCATRRNKESAEETYRAHASRLQGLVEQGPAHLLVMQSAKRRFQDSFQGDGDQTKGSTGLCRVLCLQSREHAGLLHLEVTVSQPRQALLDVEARAGTLCRETLEQERGAECQRLTAAKRHHQPLA